MNPNSDFSRIMAEQDAQSKRGYAILAESAVSGMHALKQGVDPQAELSPVYEQVMVLKVGLETLDRKVGELIGRVLPALRYDLREVSPSSGNPAEAREVVSPLEDDLRDMGQRLMRANCLLDELTRSIRL